MIRRSAVVSLALIGSVALAHGAAWARVKTFSSIEIRGAVYIAKEEIIGRTKLALRDKAIVADMESLEGALKSFAIIRSFDMKESDGRLIITIAEREPVALIALEGKNQVVPFELDAAMKVIAFNRVHSRSLPPVRITEADMAGRAPAAGVRDFCSLLNVVKKKHHELYAQIDEIYYGRGVVKVHLRGRRTAFYLVPVMDNFTRLAYVAGYCDSRGIYPESITISDDKVLIRQGA
jgi:hypothetical protein